MRKMNCKGGRRPNAKDEMETVADASNDRGLKAVACECRGMNKSIGKKYLVIN